MSDTCPNCGGLISVRNPTGKCDHLYYPENVPSAERKFLSDMRKNMLVLLVDSIECQMRGDPAQDAMLKELRINTAKIAVDRFFNAMENISAQRCMSIIVSMQEQHSLHQYPSEGERSAYSLAITDAKIALKRLFPELKLP